MKIDKDKLSIAVTLGMRALHRELLALGICVDLDLPQTYINWYLKEKLGKFIERDLKNNTFADAVGNDIFMNFLTRDNLLKKIDELNKENEMLKGRIKNLTTELEQWHNGIEHEKINKFIQNKNMEIATWTDKVVALEKENKKLKEENDLNKIEKNDKIVQRFSCNEDHEKIQKSIDNKNMEIASWADKVRAFDKENEKLKEENEKLKRHHKYLDDHNDYLILRVSDLKKALK